jgi:hypothetical protein
VRRAGRLAACLAAGLAIACGAGMRRSADVGPSAVTAGVQPWEIPAAALGTQRLYRAAYAGPEGDGSFRATLRLAAADSFELALADRLGRPLFTLRVDGDAGWWLDHRRDVICHDLGAIRLPGLGDAPVQARSLPPLLLGLLPVAGSGARPLADGELEIVDAAGRRWTATLEGWSVMQWTLWDDLGPSWWWRRDDRGGLLSGREGRQLRWQEAVVERLAALPPAVAPAGMFESCETPPTG